MTLKTFFTKIQGNRAIKSAGNNALKRYEKTFKDLARYDRGEKVANAVSR